MPVLDVNRPEMLQINIIGKIVTEFEVVLCDTNMCYLAFQLRPSPTREPERLDTQSILTLLLHTEFFSPAPLPEHLVLV